MSAIPPDAPDPWDRPQFIPGGGDAFVYFVVFDADADLLEVSTDEHRVDGIPDGLDAHELGPEWVQSFFEPPLGNQLRELDPDLAGLAEASDTCIVVTGTVADPPTLDYLRNAIGITTAALDTGGVAVLSLQNLELFDPDRWREDVFDADSHVGPRLVALLHSTDDEATWWVHTRGMRVFGRPDLSIHDVASDDLTIVDQLVNALVGQLTRGLVIDDGMTMDIGGDVGTLQFERRGGLDDPDFNNEHLEIRRSGAEPTC